MLNEKQDECTFRFRFESFFSTIIITIIINNLALIYRKDTISTFGQLHLFLNTLTSSTVPKSSMFVSLFLSFFLSFFLLLLTAQESLPPPPPFGFGMKGRLSCKQGTHSYMSQTSLTVVLVYYLNIKHLTVKGKRPRKLLSEIFSRFCKLSK